MTKNEIIRFLQKLPMSYIYDLDIVYHKMTFDGSYYYRYMFRVDRKFSATPLCDVLSSLYELRANIRAIRLFYTDGVTGKLRFLDYLVKDFIDCDSLSDFLNSK